MKNTGKALLYLGLGIGSIAYATGFVKNQKEIAEATNPLYNEMITLIEEKKESYPEKYRHEARLDFDYNGKMNKINKAIHEFMNDNDISENLNGNWKPIVRSGDQYQFPKAPVPKVFNPVKWDNEIDKSAVQKYFMDTYGKNYKKRIAHVNEVVEQKYQK